VRLIFTAIDDAKTSVVVRDAAGEVDLGEYFLEGFQGSFLRELLYGAMDHVLKRIQDRPRSGERRHG
jgi:hypothetical protein